MDKLANIGIDLWGILLYIVNYGILLFALAYFLFPKIKKAVKQRQETIKNNIESAEQLRKDLEKMMKKNEKEKNDLVKELQEERRAAQKELADKKAEMIQEMEGARNKILSDAHEQIESEKKALIMGAEKQIVSMLQRVILSILSHKIPEDVVKDSVQSAWDNQKKSL